MADEFVTIAVITNPMRREYGIPESQTYALMRGSQILYTDKDKPECIEPIHWARVEAERLRVPFVEPAPAAVFAMHEDTRVWFAYLCDPAPFCDDGKLVRNRVFETEAPILFVSKSRKAAAA